MKNKQLRVVLIMGSLVMAALFLLQAYWFKRAFDVAGKQFDHSVQVALMRVADSVSSHAEVKRLSSSFYFVATESHLEKRALQRSIQEELAKRNLDLDYELGVYRADDDTLVYGQYIEATRKHRLESAMDVEGSHIENFAIYFPRKESFVIAQLDVWIFSTIVLILMMFFFIYALISLLRERRFTELKTDFINNMTHEFKTPVTNIGITGEIIRKKIPDTAGIDVYLDILLRENEKLRSKIDEVLLGASVDRLKKPVLEQIDVHTLIEGCAEAFRLKVEQRHGKMQLAFKATSTFILGDRELLTQAINNVIDNAEKYSRCEPCIIVRTRDHDGCIEIDVVDRGIGIPPTMHRKVFEKFFRAQTGNVHNVKGFGLGLSLVKEVVQAHRGKIRLLSAPDQGTEVKILLPKV